jgi:hypothetical protein
MSHDPRSIAARIVAGCTTTQGFSVTSDEVRALATEYLRLHAQQGPDDHGIAPPPADREALREAVEGEGE